MYFRHWYKALNPFKAVQLPSRILQACSFLFCKTSFFLQGQMDIHPKSLWFCPALVNEVGGFLPRGTSNEDRRLIDIEPWDNVRRDMLFLLLKQVEERNVPGAFAEVGVYRGATAKLIHHYSPKREIYLFDTFEGFTDVIAQREVEYTGDIVSASQFSDTSISEVEKYIESTSGTINFVKGCFPASLKESHKNLAYAFVNIDADLYEPIYDSLEFFYPRLARYGFIVVHDFHAWKGANKAVLDFSEKYNVSFIPMPDKSGSAVFLKQ